MKRRGFVAGLGATAAGAAVIGSGAFESVEADRTVSVAIEDDADAYLGISEISGSDNSEEFTEFNTGNTSNERLKIDINSIGDADGLGVSLGAETYIDDLFELRNQGTETVAVGFENGDGGDDVTGDPQFEKFELVDESRETLDGSLELTSGGSENIGVYIKTASADELSDADTPGDGQSIAADGLVTIKANIDANEL